jgi:hypothetical protein
MATTEQPAVAAVTEESFDTSETIRESLPHGGWDYPWCLTSIASRSQKLLSEQLNCHNSLITAENATPQKHETTHRNYKMMQHTAMKGWRCE